jgi:phage baseplate assembly protein W
MARITRAQALTGTKKRVEYYSDFTRNFAKSPVGNELSRVVNDNSIQQSLKNLILTNLGERLFQPYIGSNILATLFENNYYENLTELEFFIQNTIDNNEPRVNLLEISAENSQNEQEIIINIIYNTINNSEPVTFNFILKRVR